MALARRASVDGAADIAALTLTAPASWVAGDLIMGCITVRAATDVGLIVPAGWLTDGAAVAYTTTMTTRFIYRIYADEVSFAFDQDAGVTTVAVTLDGFYSTTDNLARYVDGSAEPHNGAGGAAVAIVFEASVGDAAANLSWCAAGWRASALSIDPTGYTVASYTDTDSTLCRSASWFKATAGPTAAAPADAETATNAFIQTWHAMVAEVASPMPRVRSSAKSNDGSAGTSISVLMPPTISAGDDLIVGIHWEGTGNPATPSGWTLIGHAANQNGGVAIRSHFYRKTGGAVGNEDGTSVSWTGFPASYGFAVSVAIGGASTVTTKVGPKYEGSGGTFTTVTSDSFSPGAASTGISTLFAILLFEIGGTTASVAPAGWTKDAQHNDELYSGKNAGIYHQDVAALSAQAPVFNVVDNNTNNTLFIVEAALPVVASSPKGGGLGILTPQLLTPLWEE